MSRVHFQPSIFSILDECLWVCEFMSLKIWISVCYLLLHLSVWRCLFVCMRDREFESDFVGIAVAEHDLSVVRVIWIASGKWGRAYCIWRCRKWNHFQTRLFWNEQRRHFNETYSKRALTLAPSSFYTQNGIPSKILIKLNKKKWHKNQKKTKRCTAMLSVKIVRLGKKLLPNNLARLVLHTDSLSLSHATARNKSSPPPKNKIKITNTNPTE